MPAGRLATGREVIARRRRQGEGSRVEAGGEKHESQDNEDHQREGSHGKGLNHGDDGRCWTLLANDFGGR